MVAEEVEEEREEIEDTGRWRERERERWGVKWNFQLKNMSSQQLNH